MAGHVDPDRKQGESVEMRTLIFVPVYSSDPNSENAAFWDATPQGRLELGTINPKAWCQFKLGEEYYLDFSLAGVAPGA